MNRPSGRARGAAAEGWVREAVAALVLGDGATARVAAERLSGGGGWDAALACAAEWGLATRLHARLDAAMRPPAHVLAALRAEALRGTLRSRHVVERGAQVLAGLREGGIDALAIKGVGTIAALGTRAAARTTNDLDLVVRERDEAAARALLRERGYRELDPAYERHMRAIALSPQLHNLARTLRKDELEVDLHWRFGPNPPPALAAERLIARAVEVPAGAGTIRAAHPVDAVLIAVHHALRSSFAPENALRDLCDLALWWEDGRVPAALPELLDAARNAGLATSLLAAWACVLRRDPEHALGRGHACLAGSLARPQRAEALLLERHFEDVLRHGSPARFTLEVFAPRLYARWALGTLTRARRGAPPEPNTAPHGGEEAELRQSPRRSLSKRIANLPLRAWRVARELTRLRSLTSYRAVAQAQSRFH
ncbi:MAG: hypothetical protein QOI11_3109 [Candidatus Eremiobacteraeota bacterium]|jgi:hypothetical protein|nr:hypothetical protein [Candidatus Eremiobacteraeota bacterium]